MNPTSPDVERIFLAALDLGDAGERSAYLDRVCPDPEVRRHVDRLLDLDARAAAFLESPAPAATATTGPPGRTEGPGSVIGPYRLMEAIGEGGMGIVYVAEQTHPVRRRVALKVIKAGMDTRQVVARFEAERQALALMDHPNIARVLDAGATDLGRPYFVMELVRGLPITEYCDRERLSIPERLGLFALVCRAVQHAHQKGIIHRDIKPTNVLITRHDGAPVPKVIDFGIAKATGQSLTDRTLFTGIGQLVGTPLYMSPEQAEMSGLDVDTRSDVYSLGVLLYELLTGGTPFDPEALRKAALDEVRRMVREQEPPRPSTRLSTLGELLSTVSAKRKAEPRQLSRAVRGELDWIVMKALEKDRRRRYETANDFAADVVRHLRGEAVLACPPSHWYRLRKSARRNRMALCVVALLSGTTVASLLVAGKEVQRRNAALEVGNLQSRLREQAEDAAEQSRRRQVRQYVDQGTRLMGEGDLAASLPYFIEALRLDEKDLRKAEDHRLRLATVLAQCPKPLRIWFHEQPVTDVAFRRDGRAVAIAQRNGTVTVHDVGTGRAVGPSLKLVDRVDCLDFSPDGSRLITACLDHTARIWDVATGREVVPPMGHPGGVRWVSFSPDGRLVVTVARGRDAGEPIDIDFLCRVWDAATGRPVLDRFLPHFRHRVVFSPDSRSIVLCYPSKTLRMVDARTGRPTMPPVEFTREVFGDRYGEHSFSPDGRRFAVDALDRVPRVLDTKTGAEVASMLRPPGVSYGSSFSPDGRWVVTSCWDGTARVWDAATGALRCEPIRHPARVANAVFSPDGGLVATLCLDHAVRVWRAATGELVMPPLWHLGRALGEHRVFFSPDGRFLLTASADHTVRLWDLAGAGVAGRRLPYAAGVRGLEFGPNGRTLVTTAWDGTARVWDASTGAERGAPMTQPRGGIGAARLSPDGRSLLTMACEVSSSAPFEAWVWDLETHRAKLGPVRHPIEAVSNWFLEGTLPLVAWSPDGLRFATSVVPNKFLDPVPSSVRVWDARTGAPVTPLLRYDVPVFALEFSPDGRSLVTAGGAFRQLGMSGEVRILGAGTGEPRIPPIRTPQVCRSLRFSPDGRRLVVGSGALYAIEGEARVWDPVTGRPLTQPIPHPSAVTGVAFSPDGRRILTSCEDTATRLWDATTGAQVVTPMRPSDALAFSPDGRRILSGTGRGGLQLWDVATGLPVTPPLWPGLISATACFRPDSRRLAAALEFGGAVLWDIQPDRRPLEDLTRVAQVLSGNRVDATGAAVPLSMSEIEEAYEAIVAKAPATFRADPEQVRSWHDQRLGECESAGDWASAITHLDALADQGVGYAPLRIRRGLAHAALGHWPEAARDLNVRDLAPGVEYFTWYRAGLVQLAAGNRDGYRAACAGMLRHFGGADSSGDQARFTAWLCALGPDALDDLAPALALAARTASAQPDDPMAAQSLGALLYRSGRLAEAVARLTEADKLPAKPTASPLYGRLFLAMAHHRLGHAGEARRWFDPAATEVDRALVGHERGTPLLPLVRRLTLALLCQEAEALLGVAELPADVFAHPGVP